MKRKLLNFRNVAITACLVGVTIFTSCKPDEPKGGDDTNTPAKIGVKINGVVWSPYNVGASGAFVFALENYGGLYQWHRKDTANFLLYEDYFASPYPTAISWLTTNNPCPKGWCVPTQTELQSLLDTEKVTSEWTTENGINGRRFTDKTTNNSIFLPAAGCRGHVDGTLYYAGSKGNYWSSSGSSSNFAYSLYFNSGNADLGSASKPSSQSLRCVAE